MIDPSEEQQEHGGARIPLSRSERDVLASSARGASVRDVATELGLGVDEVYDALASAMYKLGASSKLEAIILALRHGDIDP